MVMSSPKNVFAPTNRPPLKLLIGLETKVPTSFVKLFAFPLKSYHVLALLVEYEEVFPASRFKTNPVVTMPVGVDETEGVNDGVGVIDTDGVKDGVGVTEKDGVTDTLGVRVILGVTDTLGVIVKDGVIETLGVGIGKFPDSSKST